MRYLMCMIFASLYLSAGSAARDIVALPPLPASPLHLTAATPKNGPEPTGIVRAFPPSAQPKLLTETWIPLANGSYEWSVELHSEGAHALRVGFHAFELPPGASLYVNGATNPSAWLGPLPEPRPGDGPFYWSPTVFSGTAVVRCVAETLEIASRVRLQVASVVHFWPPNDEKTFSGFAGSCNLDVACHDAWRDTARGIAGYGFVSGDHFAYACTGTLIADTEASSAIPYFWTANHCVESQSEAASLEAFWFFETDVCGGEPPLTETLPRTIGGADLLSTGDVEDGVDYSLLRLRSAPPEGAAFVPYDPSPQPVTTELACIHHPRGDFKRITFGAVTNAADSFFPTFRDDAGRGSRPPERFYQMTWTDGTTEGGSSGSPVLTADGQRLVGQLWGGGAACTRPLAPDYYGRFDRAYPAVRGWLDPATGDVNGDGSLDAADIQLVINVALGLKNESEGDVDGSGKVDAVDVQIVIVEVLARERAFTQLSLDS